MRIFVNYQNPACECPVEIECSKWDSIVDLKNNVASVIGIDPSTFTLSTGIRFFEVSKFFSDYEEIEDGSNIYVNAQLLGGGKKRKKKTFAKPKKPRHKKKKVKLAVLKYYRIDANNNVVCLRKECPRQACGAGTFMAKHEDRTYCGRCGLTYKVDKDKAAVKK